MLFFLGKQTGKGKDGRVWAESHVFLSPDRNHDNDFARHCIKQVLGRLRAEREENEPEIKRLAIWSDGCKAQFKLKKQLFFVSQPEIEVPVFDKASKEPVLEGGKPKTERIKLQMAHHFFASCHGKGPSDSETARFKTKARDLERREEEYMTYSRCLYMVMKQKVEYTADPKKRKERHTLQRRVLWFVELGAVKRARNEAKVTGMEGEVAKNHSFMSCGRTGDVVARWLPCSCEKCCTPAQM